MSKFESSPFVEKVHAYLNKHNITPQKGHLVVAVSGGVDSMVLLHVLHRLNYQLHVVHVNYHQRDTSSDLDQALVEKTCETLGLSYKTYNYPTKMGEILTISRMRPGNLDTRYLKRSLTMNMHKQLL